MIKIRLGLERPGVVGLIGPPLSQLEQREPVSRVFSRLRGPQTKRCLSAELFLPGHGHSHQRQRIGQSCQFRCSILDTPPSALASRSISRRAGSADNAVIRPPQSR
jgi:hypothetical protein